MKVSTPLMPALAAASLMTATASAEVINIDFQAFSDIANGNTYAALGAAPDDPANTTWNSVQFDDITNPVSLVNSAGMASSVELTSHVATNNIFPSTQTGAAAANVSGGTDGAPVHSAHALLREFISQFGGVATLTLDGLDPSATYDLYLYGGGNSEGADTRFTVGGNAQDTTGTAAATTDLTLGEDYVVFTGIAPDVSGSLSIQWQQIAPGPAGFYGLQVVEVIPEPGSMSLLGAGMAVVAFRRRKS
ncbi:MAG: PEP-CTERM sorting domain-containing protein [Planctomycetota bacterium]